MAIEQSATRQAMQNSNEMRAIAAQNLQTTDASIATFIAPKTTVTIPSYTDDDDIVGHIAWIRFTPSNQSVIPASSCWVNVIQHPAWGIASWADALDVYFRPVQLEPGLFEIRTLYNMSPDQNTDYIIEVMVSSLAPGSIQVIDKGDYRSGK